MSNLTKNYKVGIFAMFIAAALIGSVVALGDNMAFAGGKHKKSNDAEQEIEQGQANEQNAQCVSGTFTIAGCNNVGLLFQNNDGNLALGQQ
ncbi:MAG: hypothetical protein AB7V56_07500 [Candidatus Nitrosocosmicus sp.]|jgi:hypothetical protein|uniref:hypothetical protein n=1 Tax=Candidatus Nitrosocosmicus agrestis TaxID=2563600 RepID=UPI00122E08CA|nr:hypothetical protein [Candidatus Nitrosocosmicus sp. SS]KAA2281117.1 hypothetical protein F1Z66_09340 [Candidatus Nitrosocosmicus sp. SS]KAF0869417.1 hypothetical protein E5N71_05080 [Candidatus Nitrosocosmicus sp. SS]MDR4491797.1 hypothetical protein [Candidatus Nitrosocosmicus sp.]